MATNLINGRWVDPSRRHQVYNPADGTVVGEVGYGDRACALEAVTAAHESQSAWGGRPARERGDLLHAAADLLASRADEIGTLLAREAGKRRLEAVGEVLSSVEYFRWFAEEVRRPHGAVYQQEAPHRRHLSISRPAGVVATLTPWNFPCSIQARKLAPALAAGCTVVARVSDKAPLAVTEMFRCLTDAGIPAGVINLVHGPAAEITDAVVTDERVRVVSFTGSTGVGAQIMKLAAANITRPLLELGGDAPFIVFEDADVDAAVEGAMLAKFRNTGQSCIGANRFFVHESVMEEFSTKFAERVSSMTVGDGLAEPTPDLGPCIDENRVRDLQSLLDEALSGGARMLNRPVTVPGVGAYFAPVVLTDIPAESTISQEEIFGPIAAIYPFTDQEDIYALANDTHMGLAGYVYTQDLSRTWTAAERLEVGVLGVNEPLPTVSFAPMGGVKQSGIGREGADIGLEEFQDICYVATTLSA